MKKLNVFLGTILLVISTWAIAEEVEILDTYLEDLPSTSSTHQQGTVSQSPDIVVDEYGKQYRRVETADGSELYEEVPAQSTSSTTVTSSDVVVNHEVVIHETQVQSHEDLEIIELEPEPGEYVIIEAQENQSTQSVAKTGVSSNSTVSGHAFCQQNPYARECLLAKYLSLCKKDPQSSDCKSELHKFDRFCGTFPNAYKCKKANIAASCKQNPGADECKSFGQRYCQKFPKAIFCKYN